MKKTHPSLQSLNISWLSCPEPRRRRHLAFLLVLTLCYVLFLFVFRWMREPLFNPRFTVLNMWPTGNQSSLVETAYLVFMICLPAAMWAVVFYLMLIPFARFLRPAAVALLLFLAVAAIDLDMGWYQMSREHGTWRAVQLLLTEIIQAAWATAFWQLDFSRWSIAKHALALAIIWGLSGALARFTKPLPIFRVRVACLGLVFLPVIGADALIVGYSRSKDKAQWIDLSVRNPVRLTALDRLAEGWFRRDHDLAAANAALAELRRSMSRSTSKTSPDRLIESHATINKVLLIEVEGLNPGYVDSTTMPFWTQFAQRSTLLRRHYSTGNFYLYAILGLFYGSPPTFYRNPRSAAPEAPVKTPSPYFEMFARRGYESRFIGGSYQGDSYLHNFTWSSVALKGDWALVPVLLEELRGDDRRLVYTHYWGTHYPYLHAPKYTVFTPEVPDTFDYSAGNVRQQIGAIINRYKNCLMEFDDWLRAVITGVDLEQTIVVVAGNHGEEMFENGRLAHTSTLDEPQIRTPLLMYVPGLSGRVIDEVTSHADVMPTLMDVLGWDDGVTGFGRSIFARSPVRSAVVANYNVPNPSEKWAVVTADGKSIVYRRRGGTLDIVELRDKADRRVQFRGELNNWLENFLEVLRFEDVLSGRGRKQKPIISLE